MRRLPDLPWEPDQIRRTVTVDDNDDLDRCEQELRWGIAVALGFLFGVLLIGAAPGLVVWLGLRWAGAL